MKRLVFATSLCVLSAAYAAQLPPPPPPAPPGPPAAAPVPPSAPQVAPLPPGELVHIEHPAHLPPPVNTRTNPLVWKEMVQEITTKPLQTTNQFIFWVTNTATTNVLIDHVQPSCGCTVAKLPKDPWPLSPGESGPITATVNFPGKSGALVKMLTVYSSEGQQSLTMKINIPFDPTAAVRESRMQQAMADKQAVFKGDCVSCHVEKGRGKVGEELFAADCAICHDTEHQAEMVPKLTAINKVTSKEYWKYFLENGGTTLMPAFINSKGGPLSPEEIDKFAEFLNTKFPPKDKSQLKPISQK